jgi:hypothetical protein
MGAPEPTRLAPRDSAVDPHRRIELERGQREDTVASQDLSANASAAFSPNRVVLMSGAMTCVARYTAADIASAIPTGNSSRTTELACPPAVVSGPSAIVVGDCDTRDSPLSYAPHDTASLRGHSGTLAQARLRWSV